MGKGKGARMLGRRVKRGRVMFEVAGVRRGRGTRGVPQGAHKLPIKTRFVERQSLEEVRTWPNANRFRELTADGSRFVSAAARGAVHPPLPEHHGATRQSAQDPREPS